jgi:hypothetical protein
MTLLSDINVSVWFAAPTKMIDRSGKLTIVCIKAEAINLTPLSRSNFNCDSLTELEFIRRQDPKLFYLYKNHRQSCDDGDALHL